MRKTISAILIGAGLISGCVQSGGGNLSSQSTYEKPVAKKAPTTRSPIVYKYKDKLTPAENFRSHLSLFSLFCSLEASSGFSMYRIRGDETEYRNALASCRQQAEIGGDAAISKLMAEGTSPEVEKLAKDLYAKWSFYLSTMNTYEPLNVVAEAEYELAEKALLAEVKFSK